MPQSQSARNQAGRNVAIANGIGRGRAEQPWNYQRNDDPQYLFASRASAQARAKPNGKRANLVEARPLSFQDAEAVIIP